MNCTRCGAELPGSARVCPMCGIPLQQMTPVSSPLSIQAQQAMLPMPPLQSMPAVPSAPFLLQNTSPYLPTGAPAWPTTTAIPGSEPTPGYTYASPYGAYLPDGSKVDRPRPVRASIPARTIFVGLAFLVLVPLLGAAFTYGSLYLNGQVQAHALQKSVAISQIPTAQAQPTTSAVGTPTPVPTGTTATLPTPSKFDTMSSSSQKLLGILITYPDGWLEEPNAPQSDGSVVVDFRPQQQLGIVMFIGRLSAASGTASDVNTAQIQGLTNLSGVSNVQPVQATTPQRTIGGAQWDEQDATFSDNNATTFSVVSITVKHSSYFYNIFYWSPNQYYGEAVQKYMQPMISSFKFLS